jgi:hypothetical protein
VAADERGVNLVVFRLLKGHLARSVWLYAFFGTAQFLMSSAFWAFGYDRVAIPGLFLGMWGAVAAVNTYSLVWRSLPLSTRDAGILRWWASAGAPGVFITVLILLAWLSQGLDGLPTPRAGTVFASVLVTWAALGFLAALPQGAAWRRTRNRKLKLAVLLIALGVLMGYGLPIKPAALPYCAVFIVGGIGLLLLSARAAHRAQWQWPDVANRQPAPSQEGAPRPAAYQFGVNAILMPLLRRTAALAVAATLCIVLLHQVFPRAGWALFAVYLVGLSATGFVLTYQLRSSIPPLRCLPLSTNRLAGLLQIFGALPAIATLGLTLIVNRVVLNVGIGIKEAAIIALIVCSYQGVLEYGQFVQQRNEALRGPFLALCLPIIQRIIWPAWTGVMAASYFSAYLSRPWLQWLLFGIGVLLCIAGHFGLVRVLRSGIRPSRNPNAFAGVPS